ncbi:hypothetical protein [Marivirga harenae]|uniref:hypothetical protein n=1 Tax=Marivirga harenae TaxID=2010992 RepID=UPI0026E05892|nr:hypothetical protein [Marivirga harenae]WKV12611.1 hypothetical protein Q3Y49_02025 [Marivirga harenae]
MRLAQAARKLSITTDDIVDFLEIRGIVIEKDSNTKLDENAVKLLYRHFEIEEEEAENEVIAEVEDTIRTEEKDEVDEKEDKIAEPADSEPEEEVSEKNAEKSSVEIQNIEEVPAEIQKEKKKAFKTVGELLEDQAEHSDEELIIKAPKVELKGLNVIGKIDLPEPKRKAQTEQSEETQDRKKKSFSQPSRQRKPRRNQKRELSPAEIRKKEEQKDARKRERIEREKKRKREQFYKEKVLKPKQLEQKTKPTRKKKVTEQTREVQKPQPKTILGKLWRWLNT